MPMISINGADFYYELHGEGPPLILISGYTSDHSTYEPLVKCLESDFKILTFDNRGVGQTKDDAELSAELMADDVIALADALKLEKPHIAGQSMGGTIAQMVAIRHPDKIDRLILTATTAKWRQAMKRGFGAALKMRQNDVDFDLIFEVTLGWVYGEAFLSNPQNIEDKKAAILANPFPQSVEDQTRQARVLDVFDGRSSLSDIKAPTLVCYGAEDVISIPKEAQYLSQHIPHAIQAEFRCGHNIPQEATRELADAFINFLK